MAALVFFTLDISCLPISPKCVGKPVYRTEKAMDEDNKPPTPEAPRIKTVREWFGNITPLNLALMTAIVGGSFQLTSYALDRVTESVPALRGRTTQVRGPFHEAQLKFYVEVSKIVGEMGDANYWDPPWPDVVSQFDARKWQLYQSA